MAEGKTANSDLSQRVSRIEQDISGIEATLENFVDLLKEVRNEQLRPKPTTNWLGVGSLLLSLVIAGGVYVQDQIQPIDAKLEMVTNALIQNTDRQIQLTADAAVSIKDREWLRIMEQRHYEELQALQIFIADTSSTTRERLLDMVTGLSEEVREDNDPDD